MSVYFIEEGHRYVHDSGIELMSVTEFISTFFPKFEKDKWSKYVAKRDGLTQEEVLKMWKEKGDKAKEFGTLIHNYAEAIIKEEERPEADSYKEKMYFKAVEKFIDKNDFFDAELVVGDPELRVGGTIDGLSKKGEDIYLIDWKTNKEIKEDGYV